MLTDWKYYDPVIVKHRHLEVMFRRTLLDKLLKRKGNTGGIVGFRKVNC